MFRYGFWEGVFNMRRNKHFAAFAAALLSAALLCACGSSATAPTTVTPSAPAVSQETPAPNPEEAREISFRFADAQEGVERRYAQTKFFDNLTQNDLDYRLQKKGATVDEYKALIKASTRDFNDDEKQLISESIELIEKRFAEIGFEWPIDEDVVFISTTMDEECGTWAYTHGSEIYIGSNLTASAVDGSVDSETFNFVMAHEIFHVLSRNVPELRAQIYSIIGVEICPPPEFSDDVRAHIISNPDVEDYDCAGEFTIDGKKEKATVIFYAPDFDENDPQAFMDSGYAAVVPYSDPGSVYAFDVVEDFFDVVGYNTDYVIAAEECMADNFAYAVALGANTNFNSPEIIQAVLDILAAFN